MRIDRSPDPAPAGLVSWRGSIEDLPSGGISVVRDLYSPGEYLRGPVVWTESFARCDHPTCAARWSDLAATGEEGQSIPVRTVSVNYQERKAGGCDNTEVTVDGNGWTQRTNTTRTARSGSRLSFPRTV